MRPAFLCLILAFLAPHPALAETQWYSVLLDGRKVGQFQNTREVANDTVTTTQALEIELERADTRIRLASEETSIETVKGQPRAFRSVTFLSGSETRIEGQVRDGMAHVQIRNGGTQSERSMPWPEGALLAEGLRLANLAAPLTPGSRHTELAFQPSSLEPVRITSTVIGSERVELPDGPRELHKVEQALSFSEPPLINTAWIDAQRDVQKLTMPAIGVDLTLLACDRACATAPNQRADVFDRTLMQAPRTLTAKELSGSLRYRIAARGKGPALNIPETSEQSVRREGEHLIVEIHAKPRAGIEAPPQAEDTMPNDWLQSAAPAVRDLAHLASRGADSDLARMQALEAYVRTYIARKSLNIGYASALQVVKKPEGDCTEHAVLLAALGRALDIPARVVDGLVYTQRFDGVEHVFVPHAWVQAWIGDRWQSFDAALDGFNSGHLAFSSGDGDPWHFYQGLDLLGRTELVDIEAIDQEPSAP